MSFRAPPPLGINTFQKQEGPASLQALGNFGRPWRIRTADQRIKSPLLYQLS